MESDLLYVADMAKKYGKTESAIRQAVLRGDDWVPQPFRVGKRMAWRRDDVEAFLADLSKHTTGRRTRRRS